MGPAVDAKAVAVVLNAGREYRGVAPLTGGRCGGEVSGNCSTTGGGWWGVATHLVGEESGAHPVRVGTCRGWGGGQLRRLVRLIRSGCVAWGLKCAPKEWVTPSPTFAVSTTMFHKY